VAQPGDAPFPDIPTLSATLTWTTPLEESSDAWIILSTTNCGLGGGCTPSRFIRGTAEAGATSLVLELEQIHAGSYKVNAILDRNANLGATFLPDDGGERAEHGDRRRRERDDRGVRAAARRFVSASQRACAEK
jgi:hypothetical protein